MKKITFLLIALSFSITSVAQDSKMSIGLGFGVANAGMKFTDRYKAEINPGLAYYVNGLYRAGDNFYAGLEYNGSLFINTYDKNLEMVHGFLTKAYITANEEIKPYFGVMLGVYLYDSDYSAELIKQTTFGFAPEVGVKFRVFQISTVFHLPGKFAEATPYIRVPDKVSIWQLNVGWNIGIGNH